MLSLFDKIIYFFATISASFINLGTTAAIVIICATTSSLEPKQICKWFLKVASDFRFANPSAKFAGIDLPALLQFFIDSNSEFGTFDKNAYNSFSKSIETL